MMTTKEKEQQDSDWIKTELSDVELGDKRLDWRLRDTASKLATHTTASINQACDDWADTKATYRLFDNKKTTAEKVLSPHTNRTSERMIGYAQVLAIQDTSYLDYSHHPDKQGVGPIGTTKQHKLRGIVMHSTLITTTTGLPLGLVSQEFWSRDEQAKQMTPAERRKMPIEEKESNKWLVALNKTVAAVLEGTQVISVGDSESDIFELFNYAVDELHTDLLIRASQDRSVCEPEVGRLWSTLSDQVVAGQLKVHVPKKDKQPKREAIVSVRFCQVTLKPPYHLRKRMSKIPLYAVLVQEQHPPKDVEPLCWLLLTTIPVLSFDDAITCIQWYRHRWQIEVFHKVLKSGCQIEKSQLATADRLLPFIALFSIIDWRLFWLTHIARHDPDAPCTVVLTEHEWHSLYIFTHKTNRLPDQIPSVRDVTLWIAQLGGFLARRHDGYPGVTVIWRGWSRLSDIASSWLIFHPTHICG